jgi:type III pantothenate kinase
MDSSPAAAPLIAISIGNTRTQVARFGKGGLDDVERFPNDNLAPIVERVTTWWKEHGNVNLPDFAEGQPAIALASVNDPIANRLASAIEDQLTIEVFRIGDDMPVPIGQQLDRETITGVDRLLNAAAAFERLKQACVIVDAGTAITVDFVDGQGTFHGGAIAPGAAMQLKALHEHTAALPELAFRAPDAEPFGRNTTQAMLQGVYHGIRGMVQRLVEQYAEAYGAFPLVVATGGDAQTLFANHELVDRIVPELTLLGIASAARHALSDDDGDDETVDGRRGPSDRDEE